MTSAEIAHKQFAVDFKAFRDNRPTPLARTSPALWDRACLLAEQLSVRTVAKACCFADAQLQAHLNQSLQASDPLAGTVRVAPVTIDLGKLASASGAARVTVRSIRGEMVIESCSDVILPEVVRAFAEGSR